MNEGIEDIVKNTVAHILAEAKRSGAEKATAKVTIDFTFDLEVRDENHNTRHSAEPE